MAAETEGQEGRAAANDQRDVGEEEDSRQYVAVVEPAPAVQKHELAVQETDHSGKRASSLFFHILLLFRF